MKIKIICLTLAIVLSLFSITACKGGYGRTSSTRSGTSSSNYNGTYSGTNSGTHSGTNSGTHSGTNSGTHSGTNSGTHSGTLNSSAIATTGRLNAGSLSSLPNKKYGWGVGFGKNGSRPTIPTSLIDKLAKYDAYCIGSENSKKVYFTFDLGYESGNTPKILDTLKEKNTKAVFFITLYYAKKNPELVKRMIEEGHIIGNHSCKHPSFPDIDLDRVEKEVMDMHDYMKSEFGYDMTLFRFPKGEYSDRTLAAVQQLGYINLFWSFAYYDYDENVQKGEQYAYNKITSNIHNGAIILLHPESRDNTAALGRVIDTIRVKGFEISLISGKPE